MIGFFCIAVVGVFLAYGLGGAPTEQPEDLRAHESDTDSEDV